MKQRADVRVRQNTMPSKIQGTFVIFFNSSNSFSQEVFPLANENLEVKEESDVSLLQEGNNNLQTTDKNTELFGYNENINKSG